MDTPRVSPVLRRIAAAAIDASPIIVVLILALIVATANRDYSGSLYLVDGLPEDVRMRGLFTAVLIMLPLSVMAWMVMNGIYAYRDRPTPGKRLLRLRVVSEPDVEDPRNLRLVREVVWKSVGPVVSVFVGPLGVVAYLAAMFLPLSWRKDRRAFHDLITRQQVVRDEDLTGADAGSVSPDDPVEGPAEDPVEAPGEDPAEGPAPNAAR